MQGLLCTAYGTAPTLEIGELDERVLAADEVRISVGAVGIGYFDWVLLSGTYQERPALPFAIGREFSGRIIEVGAAVDPGALGKMVACIGYNGACVERAIALEAHCIYLPEGFDAVNGACVPSAYTTALFALMDCGKLLKGERVLILGAAGTVGTAAIHIALALGGRPIAVASSQEKRDHCIANGAEFTIDGSDPMWRKTLADAVERSIWWLIWLADQCRKWRFAASHPADAT